MTNIFIPQLLVVLHETVINCDTLLSYIQSPDFGASYHACISRDGTVVNLVPPHEKAYAGNNCIFVNSDGDKEHINKSVDDFAYHIALETPESGRDIERYRHTGYTEAQYKSLAWLIAKTGVKNERIVCHDQITLLEVKQKDPRSFKFSYLLQLLTGYKREREIDFGAVF